jgi:hypothetical protein
LFKAGRHDELLELLAMDPHAVWGARVLAARGQVDKAIAYARDRAGSTTSLETIARFAEKTLLKAGRRAEAFDQYALLANQAHSNLSTFRALAKKYPELAPDKVLGHLIASTPGEPGKWFATAKMLKLFDRATQLAWASPCDPKTLTRAARDHVTKQPGCAMRPRWQRCTGCRWATATNSPAWMRTKPTDWPSKPLAPPSVPTRPRPSLSRCWPPTAPCRPGCGDRSASRQPRR